MERNWENNPWTKEEILDLIKNNDKFCKRCLRKLYARQTVEEQITGTVRIHNNQGFMVSHSEFLTSLYDSLTNYGRLSYRQLEVLRKMLPKYHRQLLEEANGGPKPRVRRGRVNLIDEQVFEFVNDN